MEKRYLYYDTRTAIAENLGTALMLNEYEYDLIMARSIEDLYVKMSQWPNAEIIIGCGVLTQKNFVLSNFRGRHLFAYAYSAEEIDRIAQHGVKCIGVMRTAERLAEALAGPLNAIESRPPVKATAPTPISRNDPDAFGTPAEPGHKNQPDAAAALLAALQNLTPEQIVNVSAILQGNKPQVSTEPDTPPAVSEETENRTGGSILRENSRKRREEAARNALRQTILEEELQPLTQKTTTVSVYAAKGGVGKTTISVETAYCLALTNTGRKNFRVCIVDYNIDFGDVASTLELNPKGNTMVSWSYDIQSRLDAGEKPEDIQFDQKYMEENYLQRVNEKLQFYALVAPIQHEDSMNISSSALDVMLRNIIEHGKFDFVICDTGNNTRDASVIALSRSDTILLIATQDVTTANCNFSMIHTMKQAVINGKAFDSTKIKLIINCIIPAREAGITVAEVEETFPYECIGHIERTPDIIKANNNGKPLVLNQKHKYSKQIFGIVRYLTTGMVENTTQKQNDSGSLLQRIFRRTEGK